MMWPYRYILQSIRALVSVPAASSAGSCHAQVRHFFSTSLPKLLTSNSDNITWFWTSLSSNLGGDVSSLCVCFFAIMFRSELLKSFEPPCKMGTLGSNLR